MGPNGLTDVGPYREQHALALVVAGSVGVRLAEVTGGNGPVDGRHDLSQADLLGQAGEDVATPDAPLRAHQSGSLEGEKDLLEVGLGQRSPLCNVANRGWCLGSVQGQ